MKKYYIALVETTTNSAKIRVNSKANREQLKSELTETSKVFKLRGSSIEEVFEILKEHTGMELTLDKSRAMQEIEACVEFSL